MVFDSDATFVAYKHRLEQGLQQARKILEKNKNPVLADDSHHVHDDKFLLVEHITNTVSEPPREQASLF